MRLSLREDFGRVKTPMGLERFEVENFGLWKKIEASLMAQEGLQSKNASVRLKAYQYASIVQRGFLRVKNLMGLQQYIWFWGKKKKLSFFLSREGTYRENGFSTIEGLPIGFHLNFWQF